MSDSIPDLLSGFDGGRLWADLEQLATFQDADAPPFTRRSFGPVYEQARSWLRERMEEAGLATRRDAAGSLIGHRPGTRDLPLLVVGSHIDTVHGAGRFDGALGVLAAVEIARVLGSSGYELSHPLEVVDFTGEEPNRFGSSCVGSRAWAGRLDARLLALTDPRGETLAEAMGRAGANSERVSEAVRESGSLAAYVELHIEQGPVLEKNELDVGIVNGIVGIRRIRARLTGQPSHAGTTPIGRRRDALAAASELVLAVEHEAREAAGELIGTVGRVLVEPNAPNVVPGFVELAFEVRSLDETRLDAAIERIETAGKEAGAARGVDVVFDVLSELPSVVADPRVRSALENGAIEAGSRMMTMPSWGGHDASQIAHIAPIGMLFAPSRDGLSHHHDEWTTPEQCANAGRALLAGLVVLDERLAADTTV